MLFLSSFFFNDTATTEIYTLSLHDALPIFYFPELADAGTWQDTARRRLVELADNLVYSDGSYVEATDRKSTRLNSSHLGISYAVFCLKKKKKKKHIATKQNEKQKQNDTSEA